MKLLNIFAVMLLLLSSAVHAAEKESIAERTAGFIKGRYHVVGKYPNSDKTYYGHIEIARQNTTLTITRYINGTVNQTTGDTKQVTESANFSLVNYSYQENEKTYRFSCEVNIDINNYALLNCYTRVHQGVNSSPGFEALFPYK